jgi:hypothetical protein
MGLKRVINVFLLEDEKNTYDIVFVFELCYYQSTVLRYIA